MKNAFVYIDKNNVKINLEMQTKINSRFVEIDQPHPTLILKSVCYHQYNESEWPSGTA